MKPIAYIILPILAGLAVLMGTAHSAEETVAIQTLILEAQGEGFEGMRAVGEVIRNRAFKGSRTFGEVCLERYQFSAWNDRPGALKRLERVSGEVYQRACRAWEASSTSLQTRGSTHYCTLDTNPYWAVGKRPVVIIGRHKFFREA